MNDGSMDLESLCDLAIAGVGIARLPGLVCEDALRDHRLVRLFPDARVPVRPVSALYPSRAFLAAKVERFLDVLGTLVTPMSPLQAARPGDVPGGGAPASPPAPR